MNAFVSCYDAFVQSGDFNMLAFDEEDANINVLGRNAASEASNISMEAGSKKAMQLEDGKGHVSNSKENVNVTNYEVQCVKSNVGNVSRCNDQIYMPMPLVMKQEVLEDIIDVPLPIKEEGVYMN